jgi:ATP-binding cassette subfamily C (CFTR/MRP) protein 1
LYQHFTETLEGVPTIRAFQWEVFFEQIALVKLDEFQKPLYILMCVQRWLSIVLRLLGTIMGVIAVSLAVLLPESSSPGSIGVALTTVMSFNVNIGGLLDRWTQCELYLGAVSRTRTFERDTPTEDSPEETYDPGDDWPVGSVGVSELNVTYPYVVLMAYFMSVYD